MDKKTLVLSRKELALLMSSVSTVLENFNDFFADGDDSPLSRAMFYSLEQLDHRLLAVFTGEDDSLIGGVE